MENTIFWLLILIFLISFVFAYLFSVLNRKLDKLNKTEGLYYVCFSYPMGETIQKSGILMHLDFRDNVVWDDVIWRMIKHQLDTRYNKKFWADKDLKIISISKM